MTRLVHIMTVADSLGFVRGQIDFMSQQNFDVHVVTSPSQRLTDFERSTGIPCHGVDMPRAITPKNDLRAIAELADLLLTLEPDIVHAHTPKGGLLGMIAATVAMVPVRVYHMRGLLTFTATGIRKPLFENAERLSCRLADHVVAQSNSLRSHAIETRLVNASKISILANGSNGVDATVRFNPSNVESSVRRDLGIDASAPVVGFVGRLVQDKGVRELVDAWTIVQRQFPEARLLIVGPFETRDRLPDDTVRAVKKSESIHWVDFTTDTPAHYAAMDVVVLPSYREGFPNVPLEAAAMGKPVVATTVPGCIDAVEDRTTGQLVAPRDSRALAGAILGYLKDPQLARRHGAAGRARALKDFDPKRVFDANLGLYETLLRQHARRR